MKRNERENENLILCKNCGGYYDPAEENCPHCGEETCANTEKVREGAMDVTKYGGGFGGQNSALTRAALVIVIILLLAALAAVGVLGVKAIQLLNDGKPAKVPASSEMEEIDTADASAEADASADAAREAAERAAAEKAARESEEDNNGVSGISLNYDDISLSANESTLLVATVKPADWTGELTWSTSNKYVAVVDGNGRVTYAGGGECTVTVSSGSISAECLVRCTGDKVSKEPVPSSAKGTYPSSTAKDDDQKKEPDSGKKEEQKDTEERTEKITLNYYDITMANVGDGTQLTASGGNGTFQWSSADSSVASVSDSGMVIGVSPGQTTITCTSGNESVTCVVYVK